MKTIQSIVDFYNSFRITAVKVLNLNHSHGVVYKMQMLLYYSDRPYNTNYIELFAQTIQCIKVQTMTIYLVCMADSDYILNGILNTMVISMQNKDYKHHHRHHLGQ